MTVGRVIPDSSPSPAAPTSSDETTVNGARQADARSSVPVVSARAPMRDDLGHEAARTEPPPPAVIDLREPALVSSALVSAGARPGHGQPPSRFGELHPLVGSLLWEDDPDQELPSWLIDVEALFAPLLSDGVEPCKPGTREQTPGQHVAREQGSAAPGSPVEETGPASPRTIQARHAKAASPAAGHAKASSFFRRRAAEPATDASLPAPPATAADASAISQARPASSQESQARPAGSLRRPAWNRPVLARHARTSQRVADVAPAADADAVVPEGVEAGEVVRPGWTRTVLARHARTSQRVADVAPVADADQVPEVAAEASAAEVARPLRRPVLARHARTSQRVADAAPVVTDPVASTADRVAAEADCDAAPLVPGREPAGTRTTTGVDDPAPKRHRSPVHHAAARPLTPPRSSEHSISAAGARLRTFAHVHPGVRASRLGIAVALGAATIAFPVVGVPGLIAPFGSARASMADLPRAGAELAPVAFQAIVPDQEPSTDIGAQFAPTPGAELSAQELTAIRAQAEVVGVNQARAAMPDCSGRVENPDAENGRLDVNDLCVIPWSVTDGSQMGERRLRGDAAIALARLNAEYAVAFGTDICIGDAYRSYEEQASARARKPGLAARAGASNHGWALAVDLCGGVETDTTEQWRWMSQNAPKFGWDNPEWARAGGRGPHEPWHWEYTAAVKEKRAANAAARNS
ncbi:MAG: M15 family metallopeptidase [Actinomycetales bacterium]